MLDVQVEALIAASHRHVFSARLHHAGHVLHHQPGGEAAVGVGDSQGGRAEGVPSPIGRVGVGEQGKGDLAELGRGTLRPKAHLTQTPCIIGGPGQPPAARIHPNSASIHHRVVICHAAR